MWSSSTTISANDAGALQRLGLITFTHAPTVGGFFNPSVLLACLHGFRAPTNGTTGIVVVYAPPETDLRLVFTERHDVFLRPSQPSAGATSTTVDEPMRLFHDEAHSW